MFSTALISLNHTSLGNETSKLYWQASSHKLEKMKPKLRLVCPFGSFGVATQNKPGEKRTVRSHGFAKLPEVVSGFG